MEKVQPKERQKGVALVLVMSLLAGGMIVGVSGMNASYIDERLAGNYRATSKAFTGAENAVSSGLIDFSPDTNYSRKQISKMTLDEFKEIASDDQCSDRVNCFFYTGEDFVAGLGSFLGGAETSLAVSDYVFAGVERKSSGFGVLSGDDIEIDNNSNFDFTGALHANGEFELEKEKKFSCNGICTDESDGRDVDLPSFDFDAYFDGYKEKDEFVDLGDDDCELEEGDVSEGGVYYCDDDLTFSKGEYKNATVVAEGDIYFDKNTIFRNMTLISKGEVESGDTVDIVDSFIIAKEEIELEFRGNDNSSGWFYSQDEVEIELRGSAGLFIGSIIAQGEVDIETKGSKEFKFKRPVSSDFDDIFLVAAGDGSDEEFETTRWEIGFEE
ncbi:pilus assembly PilX N-terminal domain-containing protein [Halomonas sp. BLK-85]